MTALKNKLRVCWLKDKRLGHLTKIDGVLKALMFHYEMAFAKHNVKNVHC